MAKKTFQMDYGIPVAIYGAGALGKDYYHKLKKRFDVRCFIDKRVTSITGISIPVIDLVNASPYSECIAVVCVHDGNWHSEIAQELYEIGFDKILFLPLNSMYKKNESNTMLCAYCHFIEEQYSSIVEIPIYSELLKTDLEDNVIRKNDSYVTVWCNKELLYSFNGIEEHNKEKITEDDKGIIDVPVSAHKAYISLFRYFMFGEGNEDLYIKHMKKLNNSFYMSDEDFVQQQYRIYKTLEHDFEKGIGAIQYAPIDVRWNERGYFNILDGHHRCIFYVLKGLSNVPVRMKIEDYEIWLNQNQCKKIEKLLKDKDIIPTFRISHPILQDCEPQITENEQTVLDVLQEWLYSNKIQCSSVLELSDCQAYYSRNLYRSNKFKQIATIIENARDILLAENINDLVYIPKGKIRIIRNWDETANETYTIAMILNKYSTAELEIVIPYVNEKVKDMIFWQSKVDIEREKEYILQHSLFKNYTLLAKKCFNGKATEIGVFTK